MTATVENSGSIPERWMPVTDILLVATLLMVAAAP